MWLRYAGGVRWGGVGWCGVLGIQHVGTLAHVVTLHKHGSDVTMIEDVAH